MSDVTFIPGQGVQVPSATKAGMVYLVAFHVTQTGHIHWTCDHNVVRFGAQLPLVRLGSVPCSHARRAASMLVQEGLIVETDRVYSITEKALRIALEAGCPNCNHVTHEGKRCTGRADEGEHPCACSWPDPDNFAEVPE